MSSLSASSNPVGSTVNKTRKSSSDEQLFDASWMGIQSNVSNRGAYFRVALIGESGSEKNNVRRAYIQLLSIRQNQLKTDNTSDGSVFERLDILDSNVVTIQGFKIELMTAKRITDFERIPTMIRCSHLDAIIICYHIGSLRQFESIHQKWVPTVKRLYRNTPFIICATGIEARLPRDVRQLLLKKQLGDFEVDTTTKAPYKPRSQFKNRDDKDLQTYQSLITAKVGQSLATELKAFSYCEVSTKTYEGIEDLFSDVLNAIIASQQSKICLTRNRVGRPLPKDACAIV